MIINKDDSNKYKNESLLTNDELSQFIIFITDSFEECLLWQEAL
jgi:hypothetical protein